MEHIPRIFEFCNRRGLVGTDQHAFSLPHLRRVFPRRFDDLWQRQRCFLLPQPPGYESDDVASRLRRHSFRRHSHARRFSAMALRSLARSPAACPRLHFRSVLQHASGFFPTRPRGARAWASHDGDPCMQLPSARGCYQLAPQRTFTSNPVPMPGTPSPAPAARRCAALGLPGTELVKESCRPPGAERVSRSMRRMSATSAGLHKIKDGGPAVWEKSRLHGPIKECRRRLGP